MTRARVGKRSGPGGGKIAAALLLALSAGFLLAACPSVDLSIWDSGSSGDADGTAAGPVAGFGSLKVAGTEFTDNASTTVVDDRGRGIADLLAGMAVTVRGTIGEGFGSGTAASVTIEREIRGPVDDNGVALDNGSIRVLGQTVLVNPATLIVDSAGDEISLADLKELLDDGYRSGLEIHGGAEDNGTLHAAYIGRVQDNVVADDDVELRGTIRDFDGTSRTFRIGAQQVNYTGLPSGGRIDWPITGLADGLIVDVRGYLDAVGGAGILRTDRSADRVQAFDVSLGASAERVALEGYVLSGTSSSFGMGVPGGTVTVNRSLAPAGEAFGVGKKVRVRGTLSGSAGTVVDASSVEVLPAVGILLQGPPKDIDAAGNTFSLLGKTVDVDGYTVFRDAAGAVREGFGLASLAADDTVRVAGWLDDSTVPAKVAAARLDRVAGTAGRVSLQGPVSAPVGAPTLSIVGVTVITDVVHTDYFDKGGASMDQNAFFLKLALLGGGTTVQVRNGVFVSGYSRIDPPSGGANMEIEIVPVNR